MRFIGAFALQLLGVDSTYTLDVDAIEDDVRRAITEVGRTHRLAEDQHDFAQRLSCDAARSKFRKQRSLSREIIDMCRNGVILFAALLGSICDTALAYETEQKGRWRFEVTQPISGLYHGTDRPGWTAVYFDGKPVNFNDPKTVRNCEAPKVRAPIAVVCFGHALSHTYVLRVSGDNAVVRKFDSSPQMSWQGGDRFLLTQETLIETATGKEWALHSPAIEAESIGLSPDGRAVLWKMASVDQSGKYKHFKLVLTDVASNNSLQTLELNGTEYLWLHDYIPAARENVQKRVRWEIKGKSWRVKVEQ